MTQNNFYFCVNILIGVLSSEMGKEVRHTLADLKAKVFFNSNVSYFDIPILLFMIV